MPDLPTRLQAALHDAYRLERELGRGGMATVYLAHDLRHDRPVALKVLHPELASALGPERFQREIHTLARLQHPHILPVHDSGEAAGQLWFTMPFVEGESLRDRLTRERQLPLEDALHIARNVSSALGYAHSQGIIHRDIKPENILLTSGEALVADFGIARALGVEGDKLTGTGLAIGTPAYMSPEQAAGERELDGRTDIYALGCVLYEMLAGEPPYTGPSAQAIIARALTEAPRPIHPVRGAVPAAIDGAIAKAMALTPADRFATMAEFARALVPAPGLPTAATVTAAAPPRRHGLARLLAARPLFTMLALGFVLGLGVLFAWRRGHAGTKAGLDSDVIAVAPFDVLAPNLELWREGLVDVLSRNLDGAGPLRTVPASVVIKRWTGRADAPSATTLGRSTGARLAVFGQLVATAGDSVRLTATLFDVAAGRTMGEVEFRDLGTNIDRLADSLTVGLLRELGRARPIGAVRSSALGATTLPALKAFLQGEQFFRRTAWDSALAAYGRAVAIDSGLALAWRRMASVVGWSRIGGDSVSGVYSLRAAALNHGLAPHDSILIAAESLTAALYTASADTAWRAHQARLFATLEEATRRYPEDPEAWYELGDAHLHFPQIGHTSPAQTLEPFDRAIALDSAFGESYFHPVELTINLGRPDRAREVIAGYLAHVSDTYYKHASGYRIADQLLAQDGARSPELERLIDGASANELFQVYLALRTWPDSGEADVRVARALKVSPRSDVPLFNARPFRDGLLSTVLALRGHLREAYAVGGDSMGSVAIVAALGGMPPERATALFRRWLMVPPITEPANAVPFGFNARLFGVLPWWGARRDTASLAAFAARMKSLAAGATADVRTWLDYGAASAEAYGALARADTNDALNRFLNLPDTVCPCVFDQIVTAQLLGAKGRAREAAAVFEGQSLHFWWAAASGLWRLERGRALERVGERDKAMEDYAFVAAIWRRADPELQPYVKEATESLARLSVEK